jgi:hypothetical protein
MASTEETLPGGAYEAADEAFDAGGMLPDGARDELEAALLAAAPLIRASERGRIIALLQDRADREQEASSAFPADPGFIGAARAARVMVLIAKGEMGGEGLMP